MTVLVHSTRSDLHADAVLWGLERLGVECELWPAGEFPDSQEISIHSSCDGQHCTMEYSGHSLQLADAKVFWNRRSAAPRLAPALNIHDKQYVEQQSRQHLEAFLLAACPNALWVNRPEVARMEVNKPYQLRIAQEVGINVPATLCSNSPTQIRQFYYEQNGEVVFKSYKLGGWLEGGRDGPFLVSYTSLVDEADLDDSVSLSFSPGIFQRLIRKDFEVRTTIIGGTTISVSIRTPNQRTGDVDWRLQAPQNLVVTPFDLPLDIEAKLRSFMKRAKMVFCTFDLIFTSNEEYFFLEANQMGQFLWKEEKAEELFLLDAMCHFLAAGDPSYKWSRSSSNLRYCDYIKTGRHKCLGTT